MKKKVDDAWFFGVGRLSSEYSVAAEGTSTPLCASPAHNGDPAAALHIAYVFGFANRFPDDQMTRLWMFLFRIRKL